MENCSSKLVDDFCTVSCVSGPQIFKCESDESLLHIFGPQFSRTLQMCILMYRTRTRPLSVCDDTQLWTDDTCSTRCAAGYVLGVKDAEHTFFFASQMVVSQENSLSASFYHVQHQRLIQSTVWTCALTVCMKKVAWFHVRTVMPLMEIHLYGTV